MILELIIVNATPQRNVNVTIRKSLRCNYEGFTDRRIMSNGFCIWDIIIVSFIDVHV
jgi:hypothetical protein